MAEAYPTVAEMKLAGCTCQWSAASVRVHVLGGHMVHSFPVVHEVVVDCPLDVALHRKEEP